MSNKEKTPLIPKLRFPEFRGAGEWSASQLIDLSHAGLSNGVFKDPKKVGAGYKLINVGDMYIDTTIVEERLSLLTLSVSDFQANQVRHGDIFFTRSSLVKSGIAVSNIYLGNSNDVTFDGHLIRFRANTNTVAPLFAHYLFKTTPVREQLVARGKSGTMTTIGQSDVGGVMLSYPDINEQGHVADCLSSLDELIAAQARKVDALKTHKKGLMQQLFPREGETQPRLRCPEFGDAPDWENGSLSSIFETTSGGTPSRTEAGYWGGDIPWITTSLVNFGVINGAEEFITKNGLNNSSAKLLPKGTVLIAMYGQGKTRGQVALLDVEATTNQACAAVRPKQGINPYFVFLNLAGRYDEFRRLSNSGGQENLSQGLIREFPFAYPLDEDEQKRIADCLTSLDTLIAAATQELETLKTHKKGLMQQLFPSAEAVEA